MLSYCVTIDPRIPWSGKYFRSSCGVIVWTGRKSVAAAGTPRVTSLASPR